MGKLANNAGWKLVLTLAVLSSILTVSTVAETFIVGGNSEWVVPHGGLNYTVWAQNVSARVGDTLHFKYNPNGHNVLQVTEDIFSSCKTTPYLKTWDDGDSSVPLTEAGTAYFMCGVQGHCGLGQAFSLEVAASPNSTTPSGPGVLSPPSSAAGGSHGSRAWAVAFVSLVVLTATSALVLA